MQAFVVGLADGGHAETTQSPAAPAWARTQGHDKRWQAHLYAYGPVGVCFRFGGRVPDSRKSSLFPDVTALSEGDGPGLRQANETRSTRGRCR